MFRSCKLKQIEALMVLIEIAVAKTVWYLQFTQLGARPRAASNNHGQPRTTANHGGIRAPRAGHGRTSDSHGPTTKRSRARVPHASGRHAPGGTRAGHGRAPQTHGPHRRASSGGARAPRAGHDRASDRHGPHRRISSGGARAPRAGHDHAPDRHGCRGGARTPQTVRALR